MLEAYQRKIRYIHVDEYQDTNYAQYMLVRLLAAQSRNLCVVGDDDQSIYGWRGADIRNILDFEKDFPDAKVIKLEQNYRSTANILDAANQVIALNANRKDKALWTQQGPGELIRLYRAGDEREEAAWICQQIRELKSRGEELGRFAVLYRTNAQSRVIEESFVQAGIRYRMYGGLKFYDRKEVKDILAYLRVLVNPADDISVRRIINVPKRAIGDTTVNELARHAAQEEMPLLTACMDMPESLNARARKSVEKFSELMMSLTMMQETMKLTELVQYVIDTVGLESQYTKEDNDEARGIRYRMYGGLKFYDRKEVGRHSFARDDQSGRRYFRAAHHQCTQTCDWRYDGCGGSTPCTRGNAAADSVHGYAGEHRLARKNVEKFSELTMNLTMMAETMKLTDLVQYVIDTVGLESQYTKEDSDEARSRVENIREFVGAVMSLKRKADNRR